MEGDVAVGEFFSFDPQFHFEGAALRDAEAAECLADDRLTDPDDVCRPGLLALARLLPVLLLRRLDVVAVVPDTKPVIADSIVFLISSCSKSFSRR